MTDTKALILLIKVQRQTKRGEDKGGRVEHGNFHFYNFSKTCSTNL